LSKITSRAPAVLAKDFPTTTAAAQTIFAHFIGQMMFSTARKTLSPGLRRFSSIDVHTHMYTPKYMEILKKRTDIPRVITIGGEDRLVILPGEDKEISTSTGRPIGHEYWNVDVKLKFMEKHRISKSVVSLANPWLDFLSGKEAADVATELNDELQAICEMSNDKLYGFATLPVRNPKAAVAEVRRLKKLNRIKGVILGTPGAGNGLDHENVREVLEAVADEGYVAFLHPHYGVGNEHYADTGHALFLALGFPFETTVAVSRLIVSGTLDKIPNLKLLVAHAGAALPGLIGRLDSCVAHDHGKYQHHS
jgi:aminocarboxymuconate-semialdehyde decarboxylase